MIATYELIEALSRHVGTFMYRRVWDDVWPTLHSLLKEVANVNSQSSLARRKQNLTTQTAYTHSHRMFRAIIKTMTTAVRHVQAQDTQLWEAIHLFRCFLHKGVHEELQSAAREFYREASADNGDAVWLALVSTTGSDDSSMIFLQNGYWSVEKNVHRVLYMLYT